MLDVDYLNALDFIVINQKNQEWIYVDHAFDIYNIPNTKGEKHSK